ncbi:response regulator [Flavobacterium sp. SUN052]|uniref:response regulator n=1 Tax=Flavobacterium sp. SUN052 TaxID=3002441 RepID=UPI00237D4340|nr:response regulator [Flavobacterium sp. SUN052]MEC4005560.1 response regulator [Flavobacterium sp. SUN052]
MKKFNNIFVVDDDLVYHFIIKKLFSKCNINVNTSYFFNGLEAIDDLKNKIQTDSEPDLILLDINMPVCDGWHFLEEFRKIKQNLSKDVTVYLISSSNDVSDLNKSKLYEDEVKKYYYKPMSQEDFETIFV